MDSSNPVEAFASMPKFMYPALSPDGESLAVYHDILGRCELCLVDIETGELTQLSDSNVPRDAKNPFLWTPDGKRIIYHLDRKGDEMYDIAAMDMNGNSERLVSNDTRCHIVSITENKILYLGDSSGHMNIFEYSFEIGETTQLTDYNLPVTGGMYSPDGERIAFQAHDSGDAANRDVFVSNVDGSNARCLQISEGRATADVDDWHPIEPKLLVEDSSPEKPRCGIYDLVTDQVRWYTDESAVESPEYFTPDGTKFIARRCRACAIVHVMYDIDTGECREFNLKSGKTSLSGPRDTTFIDDTKLIIMHERPDQRPTLMKYDLETDSATSILEPEYGTVDPTTFVDCEFITYESHDGLEIEGLLYDSGERPSPAIVKVHGGPATQDVRSFDLITQFLVSRGYSVFQVNYRGSTGRGRRFKHLIIDDLGGAEQGDIAAGTQWLAEKPWIDEKRIVVFGSSYGGYSAYMQMLQYPELYAASIGWAGITDLLGLYEESGSYYSTALKRYLGDPKENYDRYVERSPITHIENLDSPLCIIHGKHDTRSPISQVRALRERLEEHGYEPGPDGDYEYFELDEGHGSADIGQLNQLFGILGEFLGRRVPVD